MLLVWLGGWCVLQTSCTTELPHKATPHTTRHPQPPTQHATWLPLRLPFARLPALSHPRPKTPTPPTRPRRVHLSYRVHIIRAEAPRHTGVEAIIAPYRKRLGERMNTVLATTPLPLSRGTPESRLGSLVAEACLGRMRALGWQVDLFVTNLGGIRKDLGAGDIQVRDVYELLPFENILVRVSLRGKELRTLIGLLAKQGGEPLAGARVLLDHQHRVKSVWIDGKALDDKAHYILGTSDYLAKTGWMSPILRKKHLESTDLTLRDAMIWALAEQGLRWPHDLDGRIRIESHTSAPHRPASRQAPLKRR